MNDNKQALLGENETEESFDFDAFELQLESSLEESLDGLEYLENEKVNIGNPDKLGNNIMEVVWDQCIIQMGSVAGEDFVRENMGRRLDLRNDAHIQTTENFAEGKIASHNTEIDYQQRYDDWQSHFKKDENGQITKKLDKRSGKEKEVLIPDARAPFDKDRPKGSAQEHMDHTVPAAEIIRDPSANAHMTKDEQIAFANSDKNLNPLNSAANESKGDSTMTEWLESERNGEKPADRFKIDEEKLREKDKEAREEYEKQKKDAEEKSIASGKKSQKAEAFRIGGKALRAAIMALLAELIRNIIGKLISWLKSAGRSINTLIEHIKEAISAFIRNLRKNLLTTGTTVAATVLSAIFGPIVRTIQRIMSLIKQGARSVKEAFEYLKKPENRNKASGVLMLEIGKIVMTGLAGAGALVLGDIIEKGLMTFPLFAAEIPLIGSLASVVGIFLGAVVSGIAGAIVLNLIDKAIAKNRKREIEGDLIDKKNEVLEKQRQVRAFREEKFQETKKRTVETIRERHEQTKAVIKEVTDDIFSQTENDNETKIANMRSVLEQL